MIASMGLMMWLFSTRHAKENLGKRVGIFTAFCGTSGKCQGSKLGEEVQANIIMFGARHVFVPKCLLCPKYDAWDSQFIVQSSK